MKPGDLPVEQPTRTALLAAGEAIVVVVRQPVYRLCRTAWVRLWHHRVYQTIDASGFLRPSRGSRMGGSRLRRQYCGMSPRALPVVSAIQKRTFAGLQ